MNQILKPSIDKNEFIECEYCKNKLYRKTIEWELYGCIFWTDGRTVIIYRTCHHYKVCGAVQDAVYRKAAFFYILKGVEERVYT